MQKVVILGARGMLGQELVALFQADQNYTVTAWDREESDVTDFAQLRTQLMDLWPDLIINAVAYNAVDACENDVEQRAAAHLLNVRVPGELAKIAKTLDATLIHYSSDYVFDGERPEYAHGKNPHCCGQGCVTCMYRGDAEHFEYWAYHEDDRPRPLSEYGKSKHGGEQSVRKHAGRFYIIRLSKLFGKPAESAVGKKSFFDTMLQLGKEKDEVRVIHGEVSKFTYAPDLARATKEIMEQHYPYGIYHVANDGACTWYEGVKELFALADITTPVVPIAPEDMPRPAQRPASSVLKVTKIPPLRHYRDALAEYLGKNHRVSDRDL